MRALKLQTVDVKYAFQSHQEMESAKENYKYVLEKIVHLKTKLLYQLSSMHKLSL